MTRLIFIGLALSACNSASVEQWGGQSSKQQAGGFRFTVNHRADRAEAYRTNPGFRLDRGAVFEAAAVAMEQASGCKAVRSSLTGDIALIKADLIC